MPRNSIATGLVDVVLPVGGDAGKDRRLHRAPPPRHCRVPSRATRSTMTADAMREVLALLRVRTGHDFSNYKLATVRRRVERRMTLREVPSIASYARLIRQEPDEAVALMQELLISVTNFFRDADGMAGAGAARHPAALQQQGRDRSGAGLDSRLRDRRGGVLDRDAARRARGERRSTGRRSRCSRPISTSGRSRPPARGCTPARRSPTCQRSACSGSSSASRPATASAASCARWCSSRSTTSSRIRRSRTSTSSPAATC